MNDLHVEPLSANPAEWRIVEMWGFVNAVCAAREAGALPDGEAFVAAVGSNGALPVRMAFSRPAYVAERGWSWDNHHADERVAIEFRDDGPVIHVCRQANNIIVSRVVAYVAVIRNFINSNTVIGKTILGSVGDSDADLPILSFASRKHDKFLIPDPYFILTRSYEEERNAFEKSGSAFLERDPRVYWRGAPSGMGKYENQFESQRVKLVLAANTAANASAFNVKFAGQAGLDPLVCEAVEKAGGFSAFEDQLEIVRYRYNVDVDGVSSSWTGLFLKLLAGGTVIKIKSDQDFRQWYYPELRKWFHYVEIAGDVSDIHSIIDMLEIRADWAAEVAEAGRALALSLTLKSQLDRSASAVEHMLSSTVSGGQVEIIDPFI